MRMVQLKVRESSARDDESGGDHGEGDPTDEEGHVARVDPEGSEYEEGGD